jgi:hypothetical protein
VKATILGAGLALALTIQTKADMLVWPPAASNCRKIMRLEHLVGVRDFQVNEMPDAFALMELLGWLGGWYTAALGRFADPRREGGSWGPDAPVFVCVPASNSCVSDTWARMVFG